MSSRSKKILEDIHPLHIIREVQKWPVLYVKDSPERANLHFKNKIWNEIAKALLPDWDSLSDSEKECKVSDLTKKWRNLRDTFKRQLATEKKIRDGYNIKKKTYVYFKHMLFLLPHVTENDAPDQVLEPKLNEYFKTREKRKAPKDKEQSKRKKYLSSSLSVPKSVDQEEIDEDRHFLMSLVPSFKKMTDDEKLTAKVEILKVIKNVRRKSVPVECSIPLADSLSYSAEEADVGEIKVELLQGETDEVQSNDSDTGDSDLNSD